LPHLLNWVTLEELFADSFCLHSSWGLTIVSTMSGQICFLSLISQS